ncbi:hypothetical protein F2P81_017624 [Scophthalmus maximus]|uniref:Uncharacterized protein n=1 Tax=Scophthalmus maximus TaxID=52904 RepID=A0A6A4S9G3_SCOMX|nr:hypothetical protein F2P81_017624 [Scophthalmus maximus]
MPETNTAIIKYHIVSICVANSFSADIGREADKRYEDDGCADGDAVDVNRSRQRDNICYFRYRLLRLSPEELRCCKFLRNKRKCRNEVVSSRVDATVNRTTTGDLDLCSSVVVLAAVLCSACTLLVANKLRRTAVTWSVTDKHTHTRPRRCLKKRRQNTQKGFGVRVGTMCGTGEWTTSRASAKALTETPGVFTTTNGGLSHRRITDLQLIGLGRQRRWRCGLDLLSLLLLREVNFQEVTRRFQTITTFHLLQRPWKPRFEFIDKCRCPTSIGDRWRPQQNQRRCSTAYCTNSLHRFRCCHGDEPEVKTSSRRSKPADEVE